jgi:hypothetical protein
VLGGKVEENVEFPESSHPLNTSDASNTSADAPLFLEHPFWRSLLLQNR